VLFRQLGPTIAGRRLADSLVGLLDEWFPGPLRALPRALLYSAFPEDIRNILGLPPEVPFGKSMMRMQSWGRSWRGNETYARGFRSTLQFVGDRWLAWWEQEYREVPPYRSGGIDQAIARMPTSVVLTIQSYGEIDDVAHMLDEAGVDVSARPQLDDDGFESVGLTTLLDITADAATDMRAALKRLRASIDGAVNIRRAEITVDGQTLVVGQLTDEQIDALFDE